MNDWKVSLWIWFYSKIISTNFDLGPLKLNGFLIFNVLMKFNPTIKLGSRRIPCDGLKVVFFVQRVYLYGSIQVKVFPCYYVKKFMWGALWVRSGDGIRGGWIDLYGHYLRIKFWTHPIILSSSFMPPQIYVWLEVELLTVLFLSSILLFGYFQLQMWSWTDAGASNFKPFLP